jgi:hypothetical protein
VFHTKAKIKDLTAKTLLKTANTSRFASFNFFMPRVFLFKRKRSHFDSDDFDLKNCIGTKKFPNETPSLTVSVGRTPAPAQAAVTLLWDSFSNSFNVIFCSVKNEIKTKSLISNNNFLNKYKT